MIACTKRHPAARAHRLDREGQKGMRKDSTA